jgi:HPt (histidine-containing phosphotransfer) domain-containing protein
MPEMDGYEMAQAIRAEEAATARTRTPIVALTAAALKGEAERCLAAGMDQYLAKPVSIPELVDALQRWLPHTAGASGDIQASLPLPQVGGEPLPLDPTVLAALTGDDEADRRALLDDYLATTAVDLLELAAARAAGDFERVAREAHKIKGAARLVGAWPLAEAATEVEIAAKAGNWSELLPTVADVTTAFERLRMHVESGIQDSGFT